MKNMFFLSVQSLSVMALFFFFSCRELDGYATPPDFHKKEWMLLGEIQEITMTAKNDVDWWLNHWVINGDILLPRRDGDDWDGDSRIVTYSSKEKDPDYPHIYHFGIYKIEFEDWFVWERFGNRTIRIRLTENKSGKDREIHFQVQAGNASENIHIVQRAK